MKGLAPVAAIITGAAILVAIALQIFVLNPAASDNRSDIRDQQQTIRSVICAQAQSTANAYRFRSIAPNGKIESVQHFLVRMQAQRQTLRLSSGLGCVSAPGFPTFRRQLRRALDEINGIIEYFSDQQKKQVNYSPEGPREEAPPITVSPSTGGVGDDGVPASVLHSHPELFPGTSAEPPADGASPPHSEPPPEAPEPPPAAPAAPSGSIPPVAPPSAPVIPLPPQVTLPPVTRTVSIEAEVTVSVSGSGVLP